ncbi:Fic family protein [Halobacterium noricense]|uniref:Fic family protein n=1 Tax=Halobacterium noricense TaxID=223182 RepID=UPI001E54A3BA|nr:Fic family protein [Halobacterium noricense]UHH24752.1 Fic family protein [Halobacterium noricense]
MPTRHLPDSAPGEYKFYGKHPNYIPNKLPPDIGIPRTGDFQDTLQDTVYQLGRLEGIGEETDTSPVIYTTMVRREAVESVLIEGADIDIEEMFRPAEIDGDRTTTKDVQEALNYEKAIRKGAAEVADTGAITLELLKDLHAILLDGVRDNADHSGTFREKPMHIPAPTPEEEPFYPPTHEQVPELMENLTGYLATGGTYRDLVDLGIVHYQFETIHPFGDGNGRLGRLLVTLQLIKDGYLVEPYLYPSAYFNEHKLEYVRKMRAVSEEGAWVPWLEFFLDGIRQQAADAVERTEKLRDLRRTYEREYGHEKTATDRLAMRLFRKPYVTANDVADLLQVTDQTARNAIRELEANGVLEETTGKQRYREYKAVDIFEIISQSL